MRIFPGWRQAGHAMRWARQQRIRRTVIARTNPGEVTEMAWHHNGNLAAVHDIGARELGLYVLVDGGQIEADGLTAGQTLRVLAALDLIPADLAQEEPC